MPLPKKGILFNALQFKKKHLAKSGNSVKLCFYQDAEGITHEGYFKELNPDRLPEILCNLSALAALDLRQPLPKQVAEEVLVLDENNTIQGLFSYRIKGYTPLQGASSSDIRDPSLRKLLNPTTAEIIAAPYAGLLVGLWYRQEYDAHTDNLGVALLKKDQSEGEAPATGKPVSIDRDMTYYDVTRIIIGPRTLKGVKIKPTKVQKLKSPDIDDFPWLDGPVFWPTREFWDKYVPDTLYPKRFFAASKAFQALAGEKQFQQQYFTAILKELIIYDPERLSDIIIDYFGDIPLNYTSLSRDKQEKLEKLAPELFNATTDKQPFADFAVKFLQKRYNEFYRLVVFYLGCKKNIQGLRVQSFYEFIQNNPSAFKDIIQWAGEENKTNAIPFDLDKIHQRYHQVWRDAQIPLLHACMQNFFSLRQRLAQSLEISPQIMQTKLPIYYEKESFEIIKKTFSQVQEIKPMHPEMLYLGFQKLSLYIASLWEAISIYTNRPYSELTLEINDDFYIKLVNETTLYKANLDNLFNNSPWLQEFTLCVQELVHRYGQMLFSAHLKNPNSTINNPPPSIMQKNHDDDNVVKAGIEALFEWISNMDPDLFLDIFKVIFDKYQQSSKLLSNRFRTELFTYIKDKIATREDAFNPCADLLGFILSEGGTQSTSLNTLAIENFMMFFCTHIGGLNNIHLFSIAQAMEYGQFKTQKYVIKAMHYACTEPTFSHPHSFTIVSQFFTALFAQVNQIDQSIFTTFLKTILEKNYKPSTGNIATNKIRYTEAKKIIEHHYTNAEKLALLFTEGGINEKSSLNWFIFTKLMDNIKSLTIEPSIKQTLLQYNPDLNQNFYLQQLSKYAKIYLNIPEDSIICNFYKFLFFWSNFIPSAEFHKFLKIKLNNHTSLCNKIDKNIHNSRLLAELFIEEKDSMLPSCLFSCLIELMLQQENYIRNDFQNATPKMREKFITILPYLKKRYFAEKFYLKAVYACSETHLELPCKKFYKIFYTYINEISDFNIKITKIIDKYHAENNKYFVKSSGRAAETKKLLTNDFAYASNAAKIAAIFEKGGLNHNSLNTRLFSFLVREIYDYLQKKAALTNLPENRAFKINCAVWLTSVPDTLIKNYLHKLHIYAKNEHRFLDLNTETLVPS